MSLELRRRLFERFDSLRLIDPHSHINPIAPASQNLADLLGYHYYTELAHSAGMPRAEIEEPAITPREKVRRLVERFGPIENTIQYSWFIETAQKLFGFQEDRLSLGNWERLYDTAEERMAAPDWADRVLQASNLEAVFLTNEFDDPLTGFDTSVYVPCLRTDDLVFHFAKQEVRDRLVKTAEHGIDDLASLRYAVQTLFHRFTASNARACAISLPPDFTPSPVSEGRAKTALSAILRDGPAAAESHRRAMGQYLFWTLAEFCETYELPFDLMIGVNRNVYSEGVHQGRDLYDSRVSLIQYRELFNAFPHVTFPISVLASVTNQELVSYAWIFPNVVSNGHWWYSNTPAYIEHDLAARLEAIPQTKQIGYYSDMYKLEFGLPKFAMYKRILAKVLAERFVIDRGWSEERAIELGERVLRGNVEETFGYNRVTEPIRPSLAAPASHFIGAATTMMAAPIVLNALAPAAGFDDSDFADEPAPSDDDPAWSVGASETPAASANETGDDSEFAWSSPQTSDQDSAESETPNQPAFSWGTPESSEVAETTPAEATGFAWGSESDAQDDDVAVMQPPAESEESPIDLSEQPLSLSWPSNESTGEAEEQTPDAEEPSDPFGFLKMNAAPAAAWPASEEAIENDEVPEVATAEFSDFSSDAEVETIEAAEIETAEPEHAEAEVEEADLVDGDEIQLFDFEEDSSEDAK